MKKHSESRSPDPRPEITLLSRSESCEFGRLGAMADLCWCYGASLTHGYTIVDDTFQYTPYAAELKSLSHGEVEGIASGYDGYTSEDLLEMIEMGPEMVLPQEVQANVNRLRYIAVLAGTNDLGHMSMPSGTSTSLGKAEVAEALVRPVVERVMRIIDCLLTGSALLRNAHSRRPIEFLVLAIPPLGAQFIGDPIFEWAECLRAAVNPALRRAGEKRPRVGLWRRPPFEPSWLQARGGSRMGTSGGIPSGYSPGTFCPT
jgi:hypothetical protein